MQMLIFRGILSLIYLYSFALASAPPEKKSFVSKEMKRKFFGDTFSFPDLKVVHLKGFRAVPGSSATLIKDCLKEEFGFDPRAIWHVSYRGMYIVELVMVKSAIPALFAALKGNKFGFGLSETYNPTLPDGDGEAAEALSRFKSRIDRDIARMKHELQNIHRFGTAARLKDLVRFMEAFRDGDSNEPKIEPLPLPYVISAFKQEAVEEREVTSPT